MQKVVVSFTTSPSRMLRCTKMVESIRRQTQSPTLFMLNVPDTFDRTGEKYAVPAQLTNTVNVNRCGRDWGPATKFVPTIAFLKANNFEDNTRIIVVDDDWCYPRGMLESYLEVDSAVAWTLQGLAFDKAAELPKKLENFRNYAQFSHASVPFFTQHFKNLHHNVVCNVLEAWTSFCVTLGMFKSDFTDYMQSAMTCDMTKYADDLTISNYLAMHGVETRVLHTKRCNVKQLVPIMDGVTGSDALRNGGALAETNLTRYVKLLHKWEETGENYLMNGRKPKCLQD